jgi:chromosome segregation ATPase
MLDDVKNSFTSYAVLIALVFGFISPNAFAEQAAGNDESEQSSPTMKPLTNFEKMELHHRRYTAAANNMAQLVKQLNQKIQEVSLAAKTAEAKDNSQNRRQLETKLRQLENASATSSIQYSQLQAQMQNEYRNYMSLSNDLKDRYDTAKDSKNPENAARDATDSKEKARRNKELKAKESKEAKVRGDAKNIKVKETRTEDAQAKLLSSSPSRDPRVMDLDPNEVRARRDGIKSPASAAVPASGPGPTLNIVQ